MSLEGLANKISSIDINDAIRTSIIKNRKYIIALNTSQLSKGRKADNKPIRPKYAKSTVKQRRRLGLPTNIVDLRVTGRYYRSYRVAAGNIDFNLTSFAETQRGFDLAQWLRKKYGIEIEGLSPQDMDKLRQKILPDIQRYILNKLK